MKRLYLSILGIFLTFIIALLLFLFDGTQGIDKNVSCIQEKSTDLILEDDFYYPKVSSTGVNYLSEIKDLHDSLKKENNATKLLLTEEVPFSELNVFQHEIQKDNTPKLVIIIDDVAFKYQVQAIHKLNLPITMSFFPPDKTHPHTAEFAKKEKIYMVHFPLEAINFHHEEIDTLHVGDNYQKIKNRVDFILKEFPNLKFTNNHTGSKFTSDYQSMNNLITILRSKGVHFVDSVTTAKTVVPRLAKELGFFYLRRDVFIDNELKVDKILKQLKKAIYIAKKRGYAIAIGHPHKVTLKALSQIEPYLNGVKLIYINELYDFLK